MRIKPITKILLLCITLLILFVSIFISIEKTYKNIETTSDKVAVYNDSIITLRGEFNKYLVYDTNVDIYSLDKSSYIRNSNSKLDSLNLYVRSSEIEKIAIEKRFNINSLVVENYKVKESYGEIKYEDSRGLFRKKKTKYVSYKKIDKSEIVKLNRSEVNNRITIAKFNKNNDDINFKLREIVTNKIVRLQQDKSNIIKLGLESSKRNFYTLLSITIVGILIIIILLSSIVSEVRSIIRKKDLDKVTLSFLVDFIKNKE